MTDRDELVVKIMDIFTSRRGFKYWWEDLDGYYQLEILVEIGTLLDEEREK
jgi:hypothetical protein